MRRETCDLCSSAYVDSGRISICMQARPCKKKKKKLHPRSVLSEHCSKGSDYDDPGNIQMGFIIKYIFIF